MVDTSVTLDPAPLDRGAGVSLWRQIGAAIEAAIRAGHHAPGERLPTEADLAARFRVNRHTIRRAMEELEARGVVRVEQGRGAFVAVLGDGRRALVINVMGRLFMDALDDPFRAVQGALQAHPLGRAVQAAVVDVHAEASSEKQAMGHSFDGLASLVVGTHTHAPTADHQILPGGTAYMTDAGMCGDYDSIIGMQKGTAALRFWKKVPGEKLAPAEGEATLCGVFVETDDATGLATQVGALRVGGRLSPVMPGF